MSQLSALTFAGCSGTSFALYYALKLLLPPAYWPLALLLIAAALGGLYFMSYKVAPKPASPPAVGAAAGGAAQQPPSLDFHRTLLPRPAAKYQYHWQQPLPSTAPASRTTTAESAGSQWGGSSSSSGHTGTDMTGPEDLTVSLGAQRQWQGGAGEGGAAGGDGLRRRAGAGQREAGAGGVGLLGGGSSSSSSSSAEQPPVAYRKLYTGRSAGRLERIKAAKAARASATAEESAAAASAAAAPTSPGSPPSTMATVRVVGEGEEGEEEEEEEESSARLEELEEEQRWAEQVSAVEGDAASSSSSSSGSPMDADARALFKLMRGLGLDSFFPALRAEALASLALLQSLAAADPERVRRVLREAGMGKVGNREALVLALAPPGSRKSASGGGGSSSSQPPVEQLPQGRLPGVKDEGVRAALGRLSVSANEAGAEMPLMARGPHASASTAGLAGLAPLM